MNRIRSTFASLVVLAAAALLLAGCGSVAGGPPAIKDVRSCLEDAKLQVAGPQGADADRVEDGVSGTTGIGEAGRDPDQPLTIVVAAKVKQKSSVKEFTKEADEFKQRLSADEQRDFTVRNGDDGTYVWVVAGDDSSKVFRDAEKCVKP